VGSHLSMTSELITIIYTDCTLQDPPEYINHSSRDISVSLGPLIVLVIVMLSVILSVTSQES
jgi:hypothetical protein